MIRNLKRKLQWLAPCSLHERFCLLLPLIDQIVLAVRHRAQDDSEVFVAGSTLFERSEKLRSALLILPVQTHHHHEMVREIARADPGFIRKTGPAIDEDEVKHTRLGDHLLERCNERLTLPVAVESAQVQIVEPFLILAIKPAGGHNAKASLITAADFVRQPVGIGVAPNNLFRGQGKKIGPFPAITGIGQKVNET